MYCTNCGNELIGIWRVCPECGSPALLDETVATPGGYDSLHDVPPPPRAEATPRQAPQAVKAWKGDGRKFPDMLQFGWLLLSALAVGCVVDIFLLRSHRGLNVLVVGAVLMAVWIVPLVRGGAGGRLPLLPTLLLFMMTGSMFFQSSGPVDAALVPLWLGCVAFFGVSCRNRLLGLVWERIDAVSARTGPLVVNAAVELKRGVGGASGRSSLRHALRGALVAIPLGALIMILLSQADDAFRISVMSVLDNLDVAMNHAFWIAAISLGAFAWMGCLALARRLEGEAGRSFFSEAEFPLVSSSVVLTALSAILVYFLAVHVKTLRLTVPEVVALTGKEYWVYIRHGFAELLVVNAIIGSVILAVTHTKEWSGGAGAARYAAWTLAALNMCLAASCAMRLWFYVMEYGLTLVRSLNAAGIVVSYICLGFLALRAARPATLEYSVGVILRIFLVCYVLWSCSLPVRLIAAVNAPLYFEGRLDLSYLAYLGPDTYPYLCDALEKGGSSIREADRHLLYAPWIEGEKRSLKGRGFLEWNPVNGAELRSLERLTPRHSYYK